MKFANLFATLMFFTNFICQTTLAISSDCVRSQNNFLSRFETLKQNYKKLQTPNEPSKFLKSNMPYWKSGKNKKIVYLLHGFIGSPFEMKPVADLLFQSGYTVVNDLIPGHGVNGFISNYYDEKKWRSHVQTSLDDIRNCSDEVSVIGFSTGALLIHDYINENPNFKPNSLVFYSPFYKPDLAFLSWMKDITNLLTSTLPVGPLYGFTQYQDIRVAVLDQQHYMQQIPLNTTTVIQKLGQSVFSHKQLNSKIPALLFISENDQVADSKISLDKMTSDFQNIEIVLFPKTNKIPHHLMVKTVNPIARQINQLAADFVLKNDHSKTTK